MEEVKKIKIKLSAAIFLLVCLVVFGGFMSPDMRNFALALSANYSKSLPATLSLAEWNNLAMDFVAKSGDSMTGVLNMNGNRITNLSNPTAVTDAASKSYVDAQIALMAASGAAGIFINWGDSDCPTGADRLYFGFGFNSFYTDVGGSDNAVCLDSTGLAGDSYNDASADKMHPLIITNNTQSVPVGITHSRAVRCAVCRKAGTCYTTYGSNTCNTSAGFNTMYTGYLMGSLTSYVTTGNSGERLCINAVNFDNTQTVSPVEGAEIYGTKIENDHGVGYSMDNFIRCAVCCN